MAVQVEQLITDHLDLWTHAQTAKSTSGRGSNNKIELTGIKKLRELILELAVRGKLVPQDPNDEPASELLKRIAAEKEALVKAGKLKKQKPLPPITDDEKPFELPVGWEWERFGNILDFQGGGQPPKGIFSDKQLPSYVQLIQIRDLGDKPQPVFVPKSSVTKFCTEKDIMIGRYGASVGKVFWGKEGAYNVALVKLIDQHQIYIPEFLFFMMKSRQGQALFGGISRSAQDGFNKGDIEARLIPIIPKGSQHKIICKVDELMSLCDLLEQQSYQQLDAHNQLVDALLSTLTHSQNADELASNWQSLGEYFDTLFTTEYSIDALKQTILQLAVMGKLVKQDPNDEPASELLKRIAAEKDILVKAGKIKKQKPLPPISDDEKPIELPQGWEWCRFNDFISLISGQHLKPEEYLLQSENGTVPYITGPAEFGEQFPTYDKFTFEKRAVASPGDVLITCKGAGLGKLNVANCEIAISRQLMAVRAVLVDSQYMTLMLSSLYDYFQNKGVGIAILGISREDILEKNCGLPPFAEQKRIVLKVNELIELCDGLCKTLDTIRKIQAVLAEALVEQVVA